jgi:hypothetical protein
MRVLAIAALLLVAACAQTPKAEGEASASKAKRVCTEEGATSGSRTAGRRTCTSTGAEAGS